ncbi:unnamed protein product [Cylicocyclus nassatus]|uniref:F-box domain-containing protein n=1 Tax=Cylicocyclus nassatus TaxID=53992 RepID=A0AA36GRC1_CYLNA|nr:unnamed protein product [Cylicocyclus nassatus]
MEIKWEIRYSLSQTSVGWVGSSLCADEIIVTSSSVDRFQLLTKKPLCGFVLRVLSGTMNSIPSSGFLSSILDNMDTLTAPCFSPFQAIHEDDRRQDSPLLNLPSNVLDNIVSFIPLKVRTLLVAPVCRALRDSVYRSITSVAFYKTQLDELSDTRIKYFLSIHGHKITAINFDLFRSVEDEACTQWNWRQSVITAVKMCSNLRELDILVCKRHRLRDTDLLTIFRECPQLQVLCIDAQYLSGHCFQVAPVGLQRLELEMCLRLSEPSIRSIFTRLKKLKVLYISELKILKDSIITGLVSNLKNLRDLSIIANPETDLDLSASGLAHLARLPRLQNLCLEGLAAVTDRFLSELSDVSTNAAARSITSLSLAFCFNFSSVGLQRLSRMPKLDSLNLDGITKREISSGLLKIAEEGRLARVLLAEGTNVAAETLREICRVSPRLRLLDLSNNDVVMDLNIANEIVVEWLISGRPSLTILTNKHLPWGLVTKPPPACEFVPPAFNVVHLHRSTVPINEVLPGSVLSDEDSSQLPHGLLLPRLRRGNRYRLLYSLRIASQDGGDSDDQKENSFSPTHQQPQRCKGKSPRTPPNIPQMCTTPPLPMFGVQQPNSHSPHALTASPLSNCVPELSNCFNACSPLQAQQMILQDLHSTAFSTPELAQIIPPDISLESWMTWLAANPSYVSSNIPLTDPLSILTAGSAGAPRPPVEIPQQPRFHYTRGPRNKRRSNPQKQPSPRAAAPPLSFSPTDFPPLQ